MAKRLTIKDLGRALLALATAVLCESSSLPAAPTKACKEKILVVPSASTDVSLNQWYIKQAQLTYIKNMKMKCDPFLSTDQSIQQFEFLGDRSRNPERIQTRQLEFVKERSDADKLIFLDVAYKKKVQLTLLPQTILSKDGDLVLKALPPQKVQLEIKEARQHRSSLFKRTISFMTPNAFSLGYSFVQGNLELESGYEQLVTQNKKGSSNFLSAIQLGQISHPDSYSLFDISFNVYPGAFYFAIDQYSLVGPKDSVRQQTESTVFHIEASGINFNLNGEMTLHSPIGATYFSLGLGPSYLVQVGSGGEKSSEFTLADIRIRVGHRAFVTKNLFFSVEIDQITLTQTQIENAEQTASAKNISRVTFAAGWYFPVSTLY